ncbi:lysostaphin resistance A-like protein [Natrinema sp. H-ect4]|uniref:CPBP family intramembrane glutamic endopeptidase n=1 Tax=Natrinema sp. H-ect4 TaxID=3242699 RepID=UPI0035A86D9D
MALQVLPDDADRLARPATVIGFVLALFVPPLLSTSGIDTGPLVGNAIKWAIVAILLVIVVRFESDSLTSIGFIRPRLRDIGWALFLIVAVVSVFALTDPLVTALGLPTEQGIAQPSLAVGIGSAITAGITEEIMFRGYPIERLIDAGYGPVAAGGLTWALFTVAHVGSGYPSGNLLQIAVAALIITVVYVRVRSLVPVILGHVVIDLVGVLAYVFS